jgi:hypothetical protein
MRSLGVRRMLQRQNESLPWQPLIQHTHQPHDEPAVDIERDNYFTPNHLHWQGLPSILDCYSKWQTLAVGIEYGKKLHASLLMPIITSIITLQIICAENGVIQHH